MFIVKVSDNIENLTLIKFYLLLMASPVVKNLLDPWSGRFPGVQNGNPLQYSFLDNPIYRGAWQATVHGVAKSQTELCNFAHHLLIVLSQAYHYTSSHAKMEYLISFSLIKFHCVSDKRVGFFYVLLHQRHCDNCNYKWQK